MSIEAVPRHLLHGPSLWALRALVYMGHDVVCLQAHRGDGEDSGWRIWLEPLAQMRPNHSGRIHLDEWTDGGWRVYWKLFTRAVA